MPGQIRDLIRVRGPDYFVYWEKQHAHHHSRLYTGIVVYFICSETCLQCNLWNWFFCYIIVEVFGTMLDAATRRASCIWNSVSTLGFTIFNLRNELFEKCILPNTQSILGTFWNLRRHSLQSCKSVSDRNFAFRFKLFSNSTNSVAVVLNLFLLRLP